MNKRDMGVLLFVACVVGTTLYVAINQTRLISNSAKFNPERSKVVHISESQLIGANPMESTGAGPQGTLVEFADYQCPPCGNAYRNILPSILQQYHRKIKFVFRNFPLTNIHCYAKGAALASIAAGMQGKFWQMHNLLYSNQDQLDPKSIEKYAAELNLNLPKFNHDIVGKAANLLAQDVSQGNRSDVNATPTFFLCLRNNTVIKLGDPTQLKNYLH